MYSKVVVPLDGSELAERALPHVAELVRDRESQVHLLSVVSTMKGLVWPLVDPNRGEEERQRIRQELEKYLRTTVKSMEPIAADVRISVRFGQPADEILTFVNEIEADLIAMSTHGRSGISRWVFGSVADRILHGATCPVLLVRVSKPGRAVETRLAEQQAQPQVSYQRILVPLDGSELAEQILPYVKALIRPNRTRIFLVSVLMTGLGDRTVALLTSYPPGLRLATTALQHAEIELRGYLRSVAAALRERGATVHIAVRQGSPADEILTYAAEVDADVIGMTTHGLSGLSHWVYGNVAGKVLQGARSPVLLVRPTDVKRKT